MNILHYVESTDSRYGGVPRFVLDASRVMASEGHRCTLMTLDSTETPEAWLTGHDGSALPVVKKLDRPALLGKLFGPKQLNAVREELKKADVVHLHCVWSPTTLQIAAAARQMKVPYVISLHGMLDDWCMAQRAMKKRAFMAMGGRRLLEGAARVHSTAQAELDQSSKWFPKGTAAIIPYLMDLEPYRHLPGEGLAREAFASLKDRSEPTILFLSRIHYKKGIEHLIRAAKVLEERGFGGKVIIAGTGDEGYVRGLNDLAKELGVAKRIEFVGQVTGATKLSMYQNADVFVLPTSQENFGLVLIEAMSCGTPIITTKGVDIWKDVLESGCAAVVDQNPEAIADSVMAMLGDQEKYAAMREKARPWVMRTYSESRLIGQYEQLYRTCASLGGKAASVQDERMEVGSGLVAAA